jgi:hypothetical protein
VGNGKAVSMCRGVCSKSGKLSKRLKKYDANSTEKMIHLTGCWQPCSVVGSNFIHGKMKMTGVFAGAFVTGLPGKSTDSGHLGRDLAFLSIPVAIAIILQLMVLNQKLLIKQKINLSFYFSSNLPESEASEFPPTKTINSPGSA